MSNDPSAARSPEPRTVTITTEHGEVITYTRQDSGYWHVTQQGMPDVWTLSRVASRAIDELERRTRPASSSASADTRNAVREAFSRFAKYCDHNGLTGSVGILAWCDREYPEPYNAAQRFLCALDAAMTEEGSNERRTE